MKTVYKTSKESLLINDITKSLTRFVSSQTMMSKNTNIYLN